MKNSVFGVTKACQMTHLTEKTMKVTGRRDGVGMLLTKFHIYSLFTISHCAKSTQNCHKQKECSFSFQNSMGFVYFFFTIVWWLSFFVNYYPPLPEILGRTGEKAIMILGTQGVNITQQMFQCYHL